MSDRTEYGGGGERANDGRMGEQLKDAGLMARRTVILAAATAVALVAVGVGCIPSQKDEILTYRRVLKAGEPATTQTTSRPAPDRPLSLEDALILANRNNEDLQITGEQYLQAIINKNRAFAAFLPTADISGGYNLSRTRNDVNWRHSLSSSTGGSWNLFNGFQDLAELRRSEFVIQQQRANLLNEQATMMLNVASAYYDVLRSEAAVRVFRSSIELQRERIRDTEARLRLGSARTLDLAQSQSQAAQTRASLRAAEASVRNNRAALAFITGEPSITQPLSDHYATPGEVLDEPRYEALALAYRQDLKALRNALLAAEQGIKRAIGQYFPSVGVNTNYFLYNDPGSSNLISGGLSVSVPIFTGGRIEADIRSAWSSYRQAGLNEQISRRRILQDVQVVYENLASATEQVIERREQIRAAEVALDLAERSYRLGSATNLDRLQAQNDLDTARLQLVNDLFAQKTSYLTLLRTAGLLTPNYPTLPVPTTAPATTQPIAVIQ